METPTTTASGVKGTLLLVSLAVVILDQWTKYLVETRLPLHRAVEVIPGCLNFTHVQNTGVAFGMFAANGNGLGTIVLTILGFLALAVVGTYYWRTPPQDKLMLTSLSLILGGAVGNLIDRLATGSVTDFIDAYLGTYHWHTFNIADSAITIGICLMALELLPGRRRAAGEATEPRATASR